MPILTTLSRFVFRTLLHLLIALNGSSRPEPIILRATQPNRIFQINNFLGILLEYLVQILLGFSKAFLYFVVEDLEQFLLLTSFILDSCPFLLLLWNTCSPLYKFWRLLLTSFKMWRVCCLIYLFIALRMDLARLLLFWYIILRFWSDRPPQWDQYWFSMVVVVLFNLLLWTCNIHHLIVLYGLLILGLNLYSFQLNEVLFWNLLLGDLSITQRRSVMFSARILREAGHSAGECLGLFFFISLLSVAFLYLLPWLRA